MGLSLVAAPAADVVSVADLKGHLRIDGAQEDPQLLRYIQTATAHLDGRDGWLNRALITQTWDWTLDAFPRRTLCPELSPLQAVASITYVDSSGVLVTLDPMLYTVDTVSEHPRIAPVLGAAWPYAFPMFNAVTIRLVLGYGAGPQAVPQPIRLAILGMASDYYQHRDDDGPRPKWVDDLLAEFKLWGS